MIKNLFEQFIDFSKDKNLNNFDKNIINLIYNNFDDIKNFGLRNGRGKTMSKLILANIGNKDLDLPKIEISSLSTSGISDQNKIGKLEVGHFRGFQDVQEFNFGDNLNVIYGRNGYGKSSFSESLEYGLTGNIKECDSRGFRNKLSGYIKNIYSKKNNILNIFDKNGNIILQNEEKFRYNFIEKNRIDFFVNSKNTSDSDLLSNLFGYGLFNDFCDDFSQTLSSLEYKDDFGKLEGELNGYKKILSGAKLEYSETEKDFKDSLCNNDISYDIDSEFDLLSFNKLIDDKIDDSKSIIIKNNQLEENNNELKKLIHVENNNYKKYNNLFYGSIVIVVLLLSLILSIYNYLALIFFAIISVFLISYIYKKRKESREKIIKYKSDFVELESINYDEISDTQKQLSKIKDLGNTFSNKLTSINNIEKKITQFKNDNEVELSKIEGIKNYNERIDGYKKGYKKFKELLDIFKNELSQGVIKESIEEKTKDIFNFLSQYKDNKIIIEKLNLPKSNNDNIKITDEKGNEYLALQVLSEGNLRALAISILFAKVLEDNLSFIICDDINNALDGEFKTSLCELIMSNTSYLKNLQVLYSTHDGEIATLLAKKSGIKKINLSILNNAIIATGEHVDILDDINFDIGNGYTQSALGKSRVLLEFYIDEAGKKINSEIRLSGQLDRNWKIDTKNKVQAIIKLIEKLQKKNISNDNLDKFFKYLNNITEQSSYDLLNSSSHNQELKDYQQFKYQDALEVHKLLGGLRETIEAGLK